MEEFLRAVVSILEQFIHPSETIYSFFLGIYPDSFDLIFGGALGLATIITIIGAVISFHKEGLINLDFESIGLGDPKLGLFVVGIIILIFGSAMIYNPITIRILLEGYLLWGYLLCKTVVAYGAYRIGRWGSKHFILLFFATFMATILATILNHLGIALIFATLIVLFTAIEVAIGLVNFTHINLSMPLLIFGFFSLALLGGIIEPEYTEIYRSFSSEEGDIISKILWLLFGYVFPIGFGIGIVSGVIQRAMGDKIID